MRWGERKKSQVNCNSCKNNCRLLNAASHQESSYQFNLRRQKLRDAKTGFQRKKHITEDHFNLNNRNRKKLLVSQINSFDIFCKGCRKSCKFDAYQKKGRHVYEEEHQITTRNNHYEENPGGTE